MNFYYKFESVYIGVINILQSAISDNDIQVLLSRDQTSIESLAYRRRVDAAYTQRSEGQESDPAEQLRDQAAAVIQTAAANSTQPFLNSMLNLL